MPLEDGAEAAIFAVRALVDASPREQHIPLALAFLSMAQFLLRRERDDDTAIRTLRGLADGIESGAIQALEAIGQNEGGG